MGLLYCIDSGQLLIVGYGFALQESVNKSTEYHAAVGKAMHVHNEVRRTSNDARKSSTSTDIQEKAPVQKSQEQCNDHLSIDPSIVKVEKVVKVEKPGSDTGKGLSTRKRKAEEIGTSSSQVTAQESLQGDGAISPGLGSNVDSGVDDCVVLKSVANVKPGRGRGRGSRGGGRKHK